MKLDRSKIYVYSNQPEGDEYIVWAKGQRWYFGNVFPDEGWYQFSVDDGEMGIFVNEGYIIESSSKIWPQSYCGKCQDPIYWQLDYLCERCRGE